MEKHAFSIYFKVGIFLSNRGALINYHRVLNDLFEEELGEQVRNKKIRTIMFSSLPRTSNLAYTYSGILIIMMMGFFLPPYLSIIRDFCHLQLTTNYTLPGSLGVGYFWTIPNNYLYHFHLFFETYSGTLSAITACSMDSLFCLYVYQLTSTMNVMSFRIMNLLPSEEFPDILKTCLTKHQKLLQCRDTLEHVFMFIHNPRSLPFAFTSCELCPTS